MEPFIHCLQNGVPFLRSAVIGVPHGFFGRGGGVSTIPHLASLNIGDGLGDDPQCVAENRRRLFAALGAKAERAVWAQQVHSDRVFPVAADTLSLRDAQCDGFVTACPGIALMVKTADCTPILLWDQANGIIGALHAGWRGSVARIAARGVEAMCRLGGNPKTICAAIGPCIRMCCYEVGDDVIQAARIICADDPQILSERQTESGTRRFADIAMLNRRVLLDAGVPAEHIAVANDCTCCHPDVFFSHRATGGKRGVMGAAIVLPE